jgi:hypothetical protein
MRAAHHLVRPGGTVVIFVPAFQFAMSRFDRSVGHVRRQPHDFSLSSMDGELASVSDALGTTGARGAVQRQGRRL